METPIEKTSKTDDELLYLAQSLQLKGFNRSQIHQVLTSQEGLDVEQAYLIVNKLVPDAPERETTGVNSDIIWGGLWLVGGLLFTYFTYAKASANGGSYAVAWGAIIFGGIQLVRGLMK